MVVPRGLELQPPTSLPLHSNILACIAIAVVIILDVIYVAWFWKKKKKGRSFLFHKPHVQENVRSCDIQALPSVCTYETSRL